MYNLAWKAGIAPLFLGLVTAQAPTVTASLAAIATGFESDNTAFYYAGGPEVLSNDGGAATGGFRIFNLTETPELTQTVHQKTGRSKFVEPVYNVDGDDYFVTIASPDSILRLFKPDGTTEVEAARKYVLGDWSTLCSWRSPVSGLQYLFLFGKKMVVHFIVQGGEDGPEVLEIQTFPIPIEGEFCAATTSGTVYFSGGDAPLYAFAAPESTDAPAVKTVLEAVEVAGLATYVTEDGDFLLVSGGNTVTVYKENLAEVGTIVVSGIEDLSIEGNPAIYQAHTAEFPQGSFVVPFEGDDDLVGVAVGSLSEALSGFAIEANTDFDPRRISCEESYGQGCEHVLCESGNGFAASEYGGCSCFAGFSGYVCEDFACKNDCSGNGICKGPNACACENSWAGPDCSFRLVEPKYETDANGGDGDDPAIWISPSNPADSKIVTTTKSGENTGFAVFDLAGNLLQSLSAGEPNNVDIIYSFPIGNRTVDLGYAACRDDNTICFFEISPTGSISNIAGGTQSVPEDYEVYGSCVYRSAKTGKHYVFVNNKDATYLQYELTATSNGTLSTTLVREFTGGSGGQVEGCVADDENGYLFLGEEPTGIWRYNAEPDADASEGYSIAKVGDGKLSADVEGITFIPGKTADEGFIMVSSQGISAYLVYERQEPHDYVLTFTVGNSADGKVDHVSNTDGITAVGNKLNADFPNGLFVTHDDANELVEGGTAATASFKFVPLGEILGEELLRKVDPAFDPRRR